MATLRKRRLPQRRHLQREGAQAVVEILAKASRRDLGGQIAVGHGGDAAPGHLGRIDRELLKTLLPKSEPLCYLVGLQGFMRCVDTELEALEVPAERRRFEHFGSTRPLHA
ncbi:hypothetical protein GCM10023342_06760 [Modicisalibacter zincidurans]|uniref:Uncharacterized protein n=1 Tax=Modicisalibacter zincidurans TaxID=1178777 RepID=A0ABP9R4H6_9GAMM